LTFVDGRERIGAASSRSGERVRAAAVLAVTAAVLVSLAGVSEARGPAVTIDYRRSSCLQLPNLDTGKVRFFLRFVNHTSRTATFGRQIRFMWLRPDGWKDSWLNTIEGSDPVPAGRGKVYYVEFGADPTKQILRCAVRVEGDSRLHNVKVLR
jgi:hypothetical protein